MSETNDKSTQDKERPNFKTLDLNNGQQIAYRRYAGDPVKPGVIFCGGFMSNMFGAKATALEEFCADHNFNFVRFDYRGHGVSSGAFDEGSIGDWTDDALQVFDRLTSGPQIIVGSSMGGWIMLHLALRRGARIKALIGIAAAPDFTEDLFYKDMDQADRDRLACDKVIDWVSPYGDSYRLSQYLFDDGKNQLLMKQPSLPIHCPVRLLHGIADPVVPWQTAIAIADKLGTADVRIQLVKDGDHSLSRPNDLELLCATLHGLIEE